MVSLRSLAPFSFLGPLIVAGAANSTSLHVNDVEYTPGLQLDAEIPAGRGPFPAAIVVHGGGWVRGDRRIDVAPLFGTLASAGIAWFSIDYRLATGYAQFGSAVSDVQAAIRFVKAHAAEYRVDPARIALIGESAGGQLAVSAALADAPDLRVKAVVALYAPTDLVSLARTSAAVPQWIRDSVQGTPFEALVVARLKELSPIEHVHAGMPPLLLIHGTADRLVPFEQSRAMCERVRAAGGECQLYTVKGGGHGLRWWEGSPALAAGYKQEMVRWLTQKL
jgi:acetyl esterase